MTEIVSKQVGQWHVQLYGALEIQKPTGELVSLNGRKVGELLAYLALYPQQSHSRRKLTSLLWGDTEVGNDRLRLRQEISALRSLFTTADESHPLVHISNTELRLDDDVQVDAIQFLDLFTRAKQEEDAEGRILLLNEAVSLFRADLLAEYNSTWIMEERKRLSCFYEKALFDMAEAYRQQRNFTKLEEIHRRLISHNALHEESKVALEQFFSSVWQPASGVQKDQTHSLGDPSQRIAFERDNPLSSLKPPVFADYSTSAQIPYPEIISDSQEVVLIGNRRGHFLKPHFRIVSALVLALVCLSVVKWEWSGTHIAAAKKSTALQPRWQYLSEPKTGETSGPEGHAAAFDWSGIYITGLTQTFMDDTDILTIKLSPKGEEIWRNRFSSGEHECDRAYSIVVPKNFKQDPIVLGQTYVPANHANPEGWYATLIRIHRNDGKTAWWVRSKVPIQKENEQMQVLLDEDSGCYIGATGLVHGKKNILVIHYNSAGKELWHRLISKGDGIEFGRMAVDREGTLYICGTAAVGTKDDKACSSAVLAILDRNGKWKQPLSINEKAVGANSANNLILDRADNILVSGLTDTGDTGKGGHGLQLSLDKYDPNGKFVWHKLVDDTGPNIAARGVSSNFNYGYAVGGTECHADGTSEIVVCRFDVNGNSTPTWHYPLPSGFHIAELKSLFLNEDGSVRILGMLERSAEDNEKKMLIATYSVGGKLVSQYITPPAHIKNTISSEYPRDFTVYNDGFIVVGQSCSALDDCRLMVKKF